MKKIVTLLAILLLAIKGNTQPTLYGLTSNNGTGTISKYDAATNTLSADYYFSDDGRYPRGELIQATDGKMYGVTYQGGNESIGVLFSLDPVTDTYAKLKDFVYTSGAHPVGSLLQASDGKLYGMTTNGGLGYGVIFSFDPVTATYTKLKDFDGTSGSYPYGSLVQASDGKLYGMTIYGGTSDQGVIFSFDPATSMYTKLKDLDYSSGAYPQGSLLQVSDGKLYGMTSQGGASGRGVIFSFDPVTATYTKLKDLDYISGAYPYGSLTQTTDGKLYGMTYEGGVSGRGVIFSFDPVTATYTKLKDLDYISGAYPYGSLTQTIDGKLCGMTYQGGTSGYGVIFSFDPVTVTYAKLKDFDNTSGAYPLGSLLQTSDGKLYGMTYQGGPSGSGVIFSFDPVATSYTKLKDFENTSGRNPYGSLLQASDGKLYGMTEYGGTSDSGVIFSYNATTATYIKLKDFENTSGRNPYGSLLQVSDGKLYGMTKYGGTLGVGVIFSYNFTTTTYTKLKDFDYTSGAYPFGSLLQASDGKLYGMAREGGTSGSGVIFSFNPLTATYTKLKDFDYTSGRNPYGSLLQTSDGKLYGMTLQGGTSGYGVIFSFDPVTTTYTKLKDFDYISGAYPHGSLLQATDGKLYGMTNQGGTSGYGVIFSFDPVTTTYIKLKDFDYTSGAYPYGSLLQASDGKLYGMTREGGTYGKGTVFSVNPVSGIFTKLQDFNGTNGGYPVLGAFIEAGISLSISCPSNIAANTTIGNCTATVNNIDPVVLPNTATYSYSLSGATTGSGSGSASGLSFNKGETTVSYTLDGDNTKSCSFTVTVNDTEIPTIVCSPNVVVNNTPGLCNGTTILIPPTVSDNCGNSFGNALNFDGLDDTVSISNTNLPAGNSPRTVTAWVKSTKTSIGNIISYGNGSNGENFNVGISNGSVFVSSWGTPQYFVPANNVNNGSWHHIAVSYNGTNAKTYVDGVLLDDRVFTINTVLNSAKIGARRDAAGEFFEGSIDEVSIWNVELTQGQIQAGMNSELSAQSGLVALYHFNQGIAGGINTGLTTVTDTSVNSNDGTLNGFALTGVTSNWVLGNLGGETLNITNNAPAVYPIGNTTVTWEVTDKSNNKATCAQIVTVVDNQVPVLTCLSNQTLNVITNTCAANYTIVDPISDNCTGATWGYVLSGATTASVSGIADGTGSGMLSFNKGVTTVMLNGTDGTNNATICSFTVTVNDNQPPVISCPSNMTINAASGLCNAVVNYSVTMTDNCSGQSATATSLSGDISNTDFNNAISSVFSSTIQATRLTFDTNGYAHSHGSPLDVYVDVHNPVTNVWTQVFSQNISGGGQFNFSGLEILFSSQPVDQIRLRSSVGQNQSFHNWGNSIFTLRDFSLVTTPASGSTFNIGTTTVSSIATDGAGNTASCSFTVTVTDNENPTITCPVAVTGNTNDDGAGNCTTTVALGTPITGDNCHVASVKAYVGIVEINPVTNLFATGQTTVIWKVTDDAGHTAQCNQLVTVTDNENPTISCPVAAIANTSADGTGNCTTTVSLGTPTTGDNCHVASVKAYIGTTEINPVTNLFAIGQTTVIWKVTDDAGHTAQCNQLVTVTDNENPTISCPVAAIANTSADGTGNCTTTVSLGTPTTGDNCHVASVKAYIGTTEINPVTNLFTTGQTTVIWKVTDDEGHTAQCNQLVTVKDNENPTIICPPASPYTKSTNEGQCTYKVDRTEFDAQATDNCTTVSLIWKVTGATTNSGSGSMANEYLNFGLNTIIWTAMDTAGNKSTCSVTVNVNKVITTTSVSVTPTTQQYSDKVRFQATVTPFDCALAGPIGGKVVFKIGDLVMGEANVNASGVATLSDISLLEDHIYDNDSNPTHGPLKPGSKTVTAHFVDYDTDYVVVDPTTGLTITCEDADVSYNGQSYFTVNPNNLSGTVVLSDYIVDRNDGVTTRGDIRNATATFENGIGGSVLGSGNLRVGLINPLNFQEGFVSTSFNRTLTSNEVSGGGAVYDVYSRVNNYYCGATDGITPVTLAMPGADFVTGGGYLVLGSNSSGKYSGTVGKKMNFGFVMKWNKSGKNLQGKVNVIYRRIENGITKVYQIRGTAIASLVVENVNDLGSPATGSAIKFRRATIVTKANLTEVTNPIYPISLGGNYDLVMTAWESTTVNTGALDRVDVQLSGTGSIGLLFSSNWVSGKTVAQTISGGKVQVKNSVVSTTSSTAKEISGKVRLIANPDIIVYPNPTSSEFNLIIENTDDVPIEVVVFDVLGKKVYSDKGKTTDQYVFGENLPSGTYFVNVYYKDQVLKAQIIKK